MTEPFDDQKTRASVWFRSLRDQIVAAFEDVEQTHGGDAEVGQFEVSQTTRGSNDGSDAGGGLMSVMRGGCVFEKVGVNVSTVYGTLGERAVQAMAARKDLSGLKDDPRFWASGISLVAHMQNPQVPAVHMNTRMFWTPHAWWFGGGSDLNPCTTAIITRATRLGLMSISTSRIEAGHAVLAASSTMITIRPTGRRILPLPKTLAARSFRRFWDVCSGVSISHGQRRTAKHS